MERGDFMKVENNEFFWDHGQKFYVLKKDNWEALKKTEKWINMSAVYPELIQRIDYKIKFTERNENFICAITKQPMKKGKEIWIAFLFFIMDDGLQRIQLETTECTNCGWRGTIANPTLPDLYLMLEDRFELMRKSAQLKKVTCPICNGRLKRDAIWVEA